MRIGLMRFGFLAMLAFAISGCPGGTNTGNGDGNGNGDGSGNGDGNADTTKKAVVTTFAVQQDGLVAAGDGIVAFGSTPGGTNGVSYIHVGDSVALPVEVGLVLRGDAVYCAGKKIVAVTDITNQVVIFNTIASTSNVLAGTSVFDISPGSNLENSYISVDGNLIAIINRIGSESKLTVINVSSDTTPLVTTFTAALNVPQAVDVDAAHGKILVLENNTTFAVFPAAGTADAAPTRFSDTANNISTNPKPRLNNGLVVYRQSNSNSLLYMGSSGSSNSLDTIPNDGTQQLINKGDFVIYYAARNTGDPNDASIGFPIAGANKLGQVLVHLPSFSLPIRQGLPGGYGFSSASTPDVAHIFIAGRIGQSIGGATTQVTTLQGGQLAYSAILDQNDAQILAADVAASSSLVAFKALKSGSIVLGYYEIPQD